MCHSAQFAWIALAALTACGSPAPRATPTASPPPPAPAAAASWHLEAHGRAWAPAASPTTAHLNGIWGTGRDAVWIVGTGGTILRYR
jgi:hypothetical protein